MHRIAIFSQAIIVTPCKIGSWFIMSHLWYPFPLKSFVLPSHRKARKKRKAAEALAAAAAAAASSSSKKRKVEVKWVSSSSGAGSSASVASSSSSSSSSRKEKPTTAAADTSSEVARKVRRVGGVEGWEGSTKPGSGLKWG